MITVGPYPVTLNIIDVEYDPAQALGAQSANLQVQNSSSFILSILTAGDVYTIQPFTAQTIPVGGQPIQNTPIANPSGLTDADTITIVWLLTGESPPMDDGPLTSAATVASIEGITFTEGAINVNVALSNGNVLGSSLIMESLLLTADATAFQFGNQPLTVGAYLRANGTNHAGGVGVGNHTAQPWNLQPGAILPFILPVNNSDLIWVEGYAGDVVILMGA
jgi:hypothetical protein